METKSITATQALCVRLCILLALAATAGCATPYAIVDAPSEDFAHLSPVQVADARERQAELERQIEEDMKHE